MRPTSAFRVCIRVPPTRPLRDVVATVQLAEQSGFSGAWFPDSPLNYREVWSNLGAVAVSTDSIEIGPTVTNPISRHPTVTASAARALAEAAPGRFILGYGSGDSAVGYDGMHPASASRVEAEVLALQRLLKGKSVKYGDFEASLHDADVDVPIFVAASGPKMLHGVGRMADAGIVTPGRLSEKLAMVAAGARASGRAPPPLFVYAMCAITDDVEATSRLLKPVALRLAQLEGREVFDQAGVAIEVPEHRAGAKGDVGHWRDAEQAARELDRLVSDEAALWVARTRAVVGDADEVIGRLNELRDEGAAGVTVSQLVGDGTPDALIRDMQGVLEALA